MTRSAYVLAAALAAGLFAADRQESQIVFRSDVSLARVDAQVVDRNNRAITGLRAEDFILRDEGRQREIRNFANEDMPVDVLLLLDVSGSMRSHVERIASAAHEALHVLGPDDRVAIMVFDRATRVRMPFRNSRAGADREFESLLNEERFNGGTDITRALIDAARYIGREGRREARRAIVIMTDDQTERDRDEGAVSRALASADAVLSALIAPDAMRRRGSYGGGWPGGGGGWPGAGWPNGGPLGGVILGRRGPGRGPGTVMTRTHSAGTEEIARRSGGDSMPVERASALEETLARLRQRYALHFYLGEDARPGQERNIEVQLASDARRRYPDADVHYRRVYLAPGGEAPEPVTVSRAPQGGAGPAQSPDAQPQGGWRRVEQPAPLETTQAPPAQDSQPQGGWRRVKPGEQP